MTTYVDSSVLLRMALRQPGALPEWKRIGSAVASVLVQIECFRTLDRFRLIDRLADAEIAARGEVIRSFLDAIQMVAITDAVVARASEPLPSVLGTLDAIHLATALLWREERADELTIATHDLALASAARSYGFPVIGTR